LKSSVNFLNVYEGDSALLMNRSGNFLIDAGRRNYVLKQLPVILPFFEKTIDIAILSHADSDHFEGLNFILDNYKVRLVILNDFDNTNDNYIKLLSKIIDKNIKIVLGVEGMKIKSFDFDAEVIYPSRSQLTINKTNEKSQLILIKTMNKNWLFTGDITDKILDNVVDLKDIGNIDILKVPHHGGKNTINSDILSKLNVKKAVISVGDNNYGHPNGDILNLLNDFKIEVLRTDILGNIIIK
jgi:competence protein ComEC